jgi:predicted nuclease of predicted toxin-antitoxin system
MKLLIDEDLSPLIASYLCQKMLLDAVSVRDRNLLNKPDYEILEYAFQEDRVLVTANVRDFERFANIREVHAGIILIRDGTLLRREQIEVVNIACSAIIAEIEAGRDMINRVLYVETDRGLKFEDLPKSKYTGHG